MNAALVNSLVNDVRAFGDAFQQLTAVNDCTIINMLDPTQVGGSRPLYNMMDEPAIQAVIDEMGGQAEVDANRARDSSVFTVHDSANNKATCSGYACPSGPTRWLPHVKSLASRRLYRGLISFRRSVDGVDVTMVTDGVKQWEQGKCDTWAEWDGAYGMGGVVDTWQAPHTDQDSAAEAAFYGLPYVSNIPMQVCPDA